MARDQEEILLAEALNPESLADQISVIFKSEDNNTENYKKLSQNERKRALNNHDPEVNYRRLLEIYREILTKDFAQP